MKIYRRKIIASHQSVVCTVDESYSFVESENFKKEAKKLKLTANDIEELKKAIATESPEASLGSSVYKFRWSPSRWNQGQSSATRVIYYELVSNTTVYLLSIFHKHTKSNLSTKELKAIREVAKDISKGERQ